MVCFPVSLSTETSRRCASESLEIQRSWFAMASPGHLLIPQEVVTWQIRSALDTFGGWNPRPRTQFPPLTIPARRRGGGSIPPDCRPTRQRDRRGALAGAVALLAAPERVLRRMTDFGGYVAAHMIIMLFFCFPHFSDTNADFFFQKMCKHLIVTKNRGNISKQNMQNFKARKSTSNFIDD